MGLVLADEEEQPVMVETQKTRVMNRMSNFFKLYLQINCFQFRVYSAYCQERESYPYEYSCDR